MKKIRFALYDQTGYMEHFADYLATKKMLIESFLFTTRKLLDEFLQEHEVDVLVLGQEVDSVSYCAPEHVGQIVMMTEGDILRESEDIPVIFKYQSADVILKEILDIVSDRSQVSNPSWNGDKKTTRFEAFYAPYGHPFYLNRGFLLDHVLEYRGKALVLNMELFQDVPWREEGEKKPIGGMTEVLFYLKQHKDSLGKRIRAMTMDREGTEYICPVEDYRDLYSMTVEDVDLLLATLAEETEYETVIFQIGCINDATLYLLYCCDDIYMPRVENNREEYQKQSIKRLLSREGYHEMWHEIQFIPSYGG